MSGRADVSYDDTGGESHGSSAHKNTQLLCSDSFFLSLFLVLFLRIHLM